MSIPTPLFTLIGFTVLLFIIVIILVVIFFQLSGRSRNAPAGAPKKGSVIARPAMQEILRLWRDPDTGRVVTEFQNRLIRDPRTLSQGERGYLVRLAQDWSTWLAIPEAQSVAQVEISPAALESPNMPAGPAVEPAPAAAADIAAAATTPAVAGVQANGPVLPIDQVKPVVTPLPAPPTPPSIVQQVDDILQEKLAAYPAPAPTIHLAEDLAEGCSYGSTATNSRGSNWLPTLRYG